MQGSYQKQGTNSERIRHSLDTGETACAGRMILNNIPGLQQSRNRKQIAGLV